MCLSRLGLEGYPKINMSFGMESDQNDDTQFRQDRVSDRCTGNIGKKDRNKNTLQALISVPARRSLWLLVNTISVVCQGNRRPIYHTQIINHRIIPGGLP
jgi:hypothetical protein